MTLKLDHVFICTSSGAPEAQALLDAGFVEGPSNVHPGQGTANRRFYFESGFLELLWVQDERQARSALTGPTRLWDRWAERGKRANPFGICVSSPLGAEGRLPFPSWAYRPQYLPDDKRILFADQVPLTEPELFALSWPQVSATQQPKSHRLPLIAMRSVSIGVPDVKQVSGPMRSVRDIGLLQIHCSANPELIIAFTAHEKVRLTIPELAITLVGRPDSVTHFPASPSAA